MKILIRVDAYPEIALGHLNRCINLAKCLKKYGHTVTFISYNDSAAKLILSKTHFDYKFIPFKVNERQNRNKELSLLESVSDSVDLLLIDSYNVDSSYFNFLNKHFSAIGYLDDLNLDFDVDLVINPSCSVKESDYCAKKVLCGLEYVILGEEYRVGRQKVTNIKNKSILITMGGIDHYNLSSRAITLLEKISLDIEVNIVIGHYYKNIELIKDTVEKSCLTINLIENISNLAPIILKNNIALTAGSFTAYELVALSTPCIGIALWKNQYNNIKCLSQQGGLIPLYYPQIKNFDKELAKELSRLINNDSLVMNMTKKARNIIDGNGADKISHEITRYYEQK